VGSTGRCRATHRIGERGGKHPLLRAAGKGKKCPCLLKILGGRIYFSVAEKGGSVGCHSTYWWGEAAAPFRAGSLSTEHKEGEKSAGLPILLCARICCIEKEENDSWNRTKEKIFIAVLTTLPGGMKKVPYLYFAEKGGGAYTSLIARRTPSLVPIFSLFRLSF